MVTVQTALRPAASSFAAQLYEEHIDEAALLYLQRATLLGDSFATGWRRVGSLEQRLEAHVDALMVGGDLALQTCVERRATEEDAGELYVAARLFAQQRQWDAVRKLAEEAGAPTPRTVSALADALVRELPHDFGASFRSRGSGDGLWMCALLDIIGRRQRDRDDIAIDALRSTDPLILITGIRSVGQLRDRRATAMLHHVMRTHPESSVRSEAAIALAKIGDPNVVASCAAAAWDESWPFLCIGLAGGRPAVALLLSAIEQGRVVEQTLLSLGLLGEISAVEPLLDHLGDHVLAGTASLALDLITGAGLMDELPDPVVHEDELFPEEKARLTPRIHGSEHDPEHTGATGTRLSTSPERWRAWWQANRLRFARGMRYRSGAPSSPRGLLDILSAEATPGHLRQLAHEELAVRYRLSVPFATAITVADQQQALHGIVAWLAQHGATFHSGAWYYDGRLLVG